MADKTGQYPSAGHDATGEFFSVSAPLHAVRPGYIRRSADDILFDTLSSGLNAHVIAPDRTGKSSLIASTSARLQAHGCKVAVLDLAQISERDGGSDGGRWFYSIAYRLLRQLRLKFDLQTWWQDKTILSNRQRLVEFYIEVILNHVDERVVVLIDEIQCTADLPFATHLLASIRAAHNARTTEPEFSRLCFALFGECDPWTLMPDPAVSPFAVSQEITLGDFSRADLEKFSTELNLPPADAAIALDQIYYWTNGQPYLSQKLARSIAREGITGDIAGHVDRIALHQLAGRAALHNEPHMSHIHRVVLSDKKKYEGLLNLYGKLRKGVEVPADSESGLQRRLLAIGLVVADDVGYLKVRNRLYERVFTARWANENLPIHWRGPAVAVAIVLAITALPFWYTQLLPRPYMEVMSSPTLELETISDAYYRLRSFPGHVDTANRLYSTLLENRANLAGDRQTMLEIARYARQLPGSPTFSDRLLGNFWDRQVGAALQNERRDDALLAALEALIVSTPQRRRRAATLVGADYPQLIGTIPAQDGERIVFDAEDKLISFVSGAQIRQWALGNQTIQTRDPWTISALEVSPLVRRVVVDRSGQVSRITLTVNVSHMRLDDLRLKLIAPSGRTADLLFEGTSSAANDEVRFNQSGLSSLVGEPLNGTWSLSIRDETTGVSGHLVGWNLNLNSQVVVENFERGLDIPDPVERESEDVWLSDTGRYAISRALQSDSARLWNLSYAQAARTIAVPANEIVLGLSENAEFLVTTTPDAVNLWNTASGRRQVQLEAGTGSQQAVLSDDGSHLLVQRRIDPDTVFELWSLQTGEVRASRTVAGTPALAVIDASGNHLAVADFDRAVRIWNFESDDLQTQIDLWSQPSEIKLSANGASLGVVHGDQGISLWRTDQAGEPLLQERGREDWQIRFSGSGERLLAGNSRQGFQVYRSSDGTISGPALGSGLRPGPGKLLAFSEDERIVVTAAPGDLTRFWNSPIVSADLSQEGARPVATAHKLWRDSGDAAIAISPGATRLATGDNQGHVHIMQASTVRNELVEASEEISFLGHQSAVIALVFSADESTVASAARDGSIRIWDAHSGVPRPFYAEVASGTVDRMAFSPDAGHLAVLSGQRVSLIDTSDGSMLADLALGEVHTAMGFAANDLLYLGANSGTLRSLSSDRAGNWNLRNVWQGTAALQSLAVSATRRQMVLVDALNQAQLLNLGSGQMAAVPLQLQARVSDVSFSPSESRVLFKTSGWIHRAALTPRGLMWLDAIRAPRALAGSRMVFDSVDSSGDAIREVASDPAGDRIILLTRDTGFAEVAELRFSYAEGPTLVGNKDGLLADWRARLGRVALPQASPAVALPQPVPALPLAQ